ncbi:hypothetical protein ACQPYK_05875 [Streptosporangium sp. CA-135522]|uniref:hypothetical protein n=1 Tax=Streptosporangium sp. CA-135522 TaxID=3240072 RepID=UPI003D903C32
MGEVVGQGRLRQDHLLHLLGQGGSPPGTYDIQAVVYRGDAAAETARRIRGYRREGARSVELGGAKGCLVRMGEAGRVDDDDELGTSTIMM